MDIVVFDMGQLAIARSTTMHRDVLRVSLPNIGTLIEVPVASEVSPREGIFRAMDQMLESLEMPSSDGRWCRVALYNPLTHQIAFKAIPHTEVYTDGTALEVPLYGLPAQAEDGSVLIGARRLQRLVANTSSTRSALASHNA